MIDLSGKVVLVTGGSRGIGASIVRTLGQAGARVIVHYGANADAANRLVGELGADRAVAIAAPLDQDGAAAALWSAAVAWRGQIDVLVNNAGVAIEAGPDGPLDAWRAAWDTTWRINVLAVADLCRDAVAHFRSRGGGTIINISSRAAFRGDDPQYMHYAASKGAVVALTKSIARGYARERVLAYGVAPGWVHTDMAEQWIHITGMEPLVRDIPMGAMAPPQDVANVVVFLASGLAPHATGTTIDINGASYVR
jgi:3-oxoacyl-[acyl-carrier protein] reductase